MTEVQDPALDLVEPYTVGLGLFILPVQIPLQSLPTLQQIDISAQFGVICKLTAGSLGETSLCFLLSILSPFLLYSSYSCPLRHIGSMPQKVSELHANQNTEFAEKKQ